MVLITASLLTIIIPRSVFSEPNTPVIAEAIYKITTKQLEPVSPMYIGEIPKPIPKSILAIQKPGAKYIPKVQVVSKVSTGWSGATKQQVQEAIIRWANHYGVSSAQLLRVAECESHFDPNANNGSHFGVFQFAPSTFSANAARCGAGTDIWNIENQAKTAAYMFSKGQSGQWSCK